MQRTGKLVTSASLLLAVALGAFATSKLVFLKEVGVGVAAAVLIDAFIVRSLLVPSLMALLGRQNWWSPAPLSRLYDRLGAGEVKGTPEPASPPEACHHPLKAGGRRSGPLAPGPSRLTVFGNSPQGGTRAVSGRRPSGLDGIAGTGRVRLGTG
jgi:hypothetical protein